MGDEAAQAATDTGTGAQGGDEGREYLFPSSGETAISEALSGAEANKQESTAQSTASEAEAAQAAIDAANGEGDGAKATKDGDTASSEKGQEAKSDEKAAPEVKAEDILSHLSPTELPEQKVARLERDYSASSKEALRLKGVNESLQQTLNDQQIELVTDAEGKVIGLAPAKGYFKDGAKAEVKFDSLSDDVQELIESDPQAFVDKVLDKAKSSLVRIAPTVEKAIKQLSPERIAAVESHMKGLTEADGTPKFESFDANLKTVHDYLHAPEQSQALKDFYSEAPDMATEFAYLKIEAAKTFLQKQAQASIDAQNKKEQESADTLHPGPSKGSGSANLVSDGDLAALGSKAGDAIAGARGF